MHMKIITASLGTPGYYDKWINRGLCMSGGWGGGGYMETAHPTVHKWTPGEANAQLSLYRSVVWVL